MGCVCCVRDASVLWKAKRDTAGENSGIVDVMSSGHKQWERPMGECGASWLRIVWINPSDNASRRDKDPQKNDQSDVLLASRHL